MTTASSRKITHHSRSVHLLHGHLTVLLCEPGSRPHLADAAVLSTAADPQRSISSCKHHTRDTESKDAQGHTSRQPSCGVSARSMMCIPCMMLTAWDPPFKPLAMC